MSEFTHKGTEALQHLADEVEQERKDKGHTPFDDIPESEEGVRTSADGTGTQASSETEVVEGSPAGGLTQPRSPGL